MNLTENVILGALISALLDADYRVQLSDQDGGGLYAYVWSADSQQTPDGFDSWVRMTPGNEYLITDYTTDLEPVMVKVTALVDALRGEA